jgi:RNA polymerase sigma-70 factor (ECF subfamily)
MEPLASESEETQRLLQEAREGVPAARDRLLERHRAYLRRFVEVRLDPKIQARVDPSDVVQETQMEALRRLGRYLDKPPMPFRLWLRQLAYDRLLMVRRQHVQAARRAVQREVALSDRSSLQLAGQVLATESTPSQQLVRHELVRRVRQAVGLLPEGDREVLIMRNLEGLSNREVSQVLAIDPATASRRYGRAVLRLRDILLRSDLLESEA